MRHAPPPPYVLATCASAPQCVFANGAVDRAAIDHNIAQTIALAERAVGDHGARLVVFPQFGLTGYAMVSPEAWHDAAFALPGPEIERIAEASRRTGAWIAVQVPERHDAFPGRHFLSCVIVGPDDGIALVHRKGYSLSLRTSPIDVYERFVEVFGKEAFHPVIDTPIGRLGAVIGAELHWPEVCRSLALNGTQVVLNPIAAAPHLDYLQRAGALQVRPVRAFENMVYLAAANIAGPEGAPRSTIFDYKGASIANPAPDAPDITLATIDIPALEAWRREPSANFLAQIQADTTVQPDPSHHWPRNAWPAHAPSGFEDLIATEAAAWDKFNAQWG
ncbi:nitrilase-related carbon-nitrogen hydrolase [Novosphingobium resinovorum]|uniref:Nitrilase/cyanide hydratase and apolipoprotein N-acyltransferase n=1 Tax=Novosphingobium resinovorum TaxID=158500 RepID=A0A031JUF0_9SPHN|nr:nitrilase-related carbon-nitrogen hydrolase [Novosphingobium resinovorum]AOR79473.1 hypothetical protein BES08_21910 [Novosphingobium resinovorum]EZP80585.1 Nitrilase/cyanide hydratase and apolipoprotein N-acyltransferase [Novosphingobium resinovorum]